MIVPGDWMVDVVDMICDISGGEVVASNIVHLAVSGVERIEIGH